MSSITSTEREEGIQSPKKSSKSVLKIKALTSLSLFILGLIVTVTGIGLWIAPSGPFSRGFTFLGMSKPLMLDLHIWLGFLLVFLVLAHLVLNAKMFFQEWKQFLKS
ncbi:DUF4405 domain-containing protein [Heliorestis convoluta]|uniref:Flavinylation-associated cytochrome domain-containing protein n=1 Tax=Heliorestis convoluta TaxID=356322 RepID=A0A5Q2MY15_9FIRM|nr:DUF4405 domain-containing protein [Heliorestis convoluta]QGG46263.1 hypothetical protein FTV88_0084 [Heliorestis convoluta]